MSNAFKCDKCETYYDFFFQHPKIVLEDETRMYLCRDCVGEYREIINLWLGKGYFSKEFNEKISSMLNKEKKREQEPIDMKKYYADDIDDHTSVWGGAGPDCRTGRREAAHTVYHHANALFGYYRVRFNLDAFSLYYKKEREIINNTKIAWNKRIREYNKHLKKLLFIKRVFKFIRLKRKVGYIDL